MTKNNMRELELYIHIPFCVQKCKYCDFLSAPATTQVQNAYMEALLAEIEATDVQGYQVVSVFIGGGTPTAVSPEWIVKLLEVVRGRFLMSEGAEITMEMNPGTITRESLQIYKNAGINRLSIGCQSALDTELSKIGRIHDFAQFLATYQMVRDAGFDNVNVDLMSGLPEQTLADWKLSLERITGLVPPPEHISAYSLIVEEGTPFYAMHERGELVLPDEDTERVMYRVTAEMLESLGYRQYEISNYAKPGFACVHNCGYWTRRDYLGFGIGAASLLENTRFHNTVSLQDYVKAPTDSRQDIQALTVKEQIEETMFLGLRMTEGVDIVAFCEKFGVPMDQIYGNQIAELISQGLLEYQGTRLALTPSGIDVSNYVMAKFLFEE